MMLIDITEADDPAIAPYRDIRERDLIKRDNLFVAEGKTVLAVLVAQKRFAIHSVLILENRLDGVADILAQLPSSAPCYVVNRHVMDTVAGFPMHRGILALAHTTGQIGACEGKQWRHVVALSAISNHDNMGAIFRNAAAFGADAVLLDAQCCDPLYRKSIRVSVGGVLTVPFKCYANTDDMLDWLETNGFETVGLSPSGTTRLQQWQPGNKTALLMGSEGPGLDAQTMQRVRTVSIPMAPGFDSLNVATATGIALAHVYQNTAQTTQ